MRSNVGKVLLVVLIAVAVGVSGCGKKEKDPVVARVGNVNITQSQVAARIDELPPYAKQQFMGPEGMIDFLGRMVDEEVLFQAAKQRGYDRDPDVTKVVEAVKRRSMIQTFYQKDIEAAVQVPEEEVSKYYAEHGEQFLQRAKIKFRHIMTNTKAEADRARKRILGGEDFASVARDVSTDTATKSAGGLTGSIALGQDLPKAGMNAAFIEKLFQWKPGELTEPLKSEKGWHVVRIEEKLEASERPLEEVKEQIVASLKPAKVKEVYEKSLADLKKKYRATINEKALRPQGRSEEELFTLAQGTEDPMERLNYYSELVFNYPDGDHAAEAQFMIGFIQSEELKNYDAARNAFQRMVDKYPNHELVNSAKWMLENMGKETPPFQEPGKAPASQPGNAPPKK